MNRFTALAATAALAAGASMSGSAPAFSADLSRGYYVENTVCSEDWVLRRIVRNFDHQVKNVPGLPNVEILEFRNIRYDRHLPEGEVWPVARTYCEAQVQLSDGRSPVVWYFIEEGMGFAGVGHNVEACVAGFDVWNVYDGRCRVAR